MWRILKLQLIVGLVLVVFAISSSAQTQSSTANLSLPNASQQDSEILKLLEKTKLELDFANQKNQLLQDRLQAKDATIKALEGTITVRDEQLKLAQESISARTQVNTGDARILSMCEASLAKADARIYALEHPGLLKRLFSTEFLGGFGAGYATKSFMK